MEKPPPRRCFRPWLWDQTLPSWAVGDAGLTLVPGFSTPTQARV